ncbi:hypothetical protein HAZT_HAZT000837 [Hyalella azteca]|uniref:G-protein coupled receptors family 1 profile domain-containing protein n=1 Tax=Hyalella azteca TaxID=294128 RepID=A0A6A0GYQ8_HYAAZ|nr:hypothetical protein HAZT_HAZT000837 [Hyalella azteca]
MLTLIFTHSRIILVCWVLGTVIGLLPLFGWHLECRLCLFTAVMDPSYLVFLYLTTIVGPGILMAFFYGHIFSVVIKQVRVTDIHHY